MKFFSADWYRQEANTFVQIVQNLVPEVQLDYTAGSIYTLERFIAEQFDPPRSNYVGDNLPIGIGCYIGEVIIRTVGGNWNSEGKPEINNIGPIQAIYPMQKALKRFKNGSEESLAWYYQTIVRYAGQESLTQIHK